MNNLEEENQMLREQMANMQAKVEKLTGMVTTMMATQNQVSASVPQPSNALVPPPVSFAPFSASQLVMPEGCPW
ncbi:hypothetical protein A2U01_0102854, partial [Trifolium medium]|nr:hypothetical protein [Trifolium medium]